MGLVTVEGLVMSLRASGASANPTWWTILCVGVGAGTDLHMSTHPPPLREPWHNPPSDPGEDDGVQEVVG